MTDSATTATSVPPAPPDSSLRDRILDIVVREGMIAREKLVGSATLDDLGVQSLDIVIMLNAFEDEFGIYVPVDQSMADVKTVDDLVALIEDLITNPVPVPHTTPKA